MITKQIWFVTNFGKGIINGSQEFHKISEDELIIPPENLNLRVYEEGQSENENIDEIAFIGATVTESGGKVIVNVIGSQNLQQTLSNGKTATFIDDYGFQTFLNLGENLDDTTSFIFNISEIGSFGTRLTELLINVGEVSIKTQYNEKRALISSFAGNPFLQSLKFFQTLGPGLVSRHDQKITFEDVEEVIEANINVEYVPKPKYVTGKYYLITQDDLNEIINTYITPLSSTGNTIQFDKLREYNYSTPESGDILEDLTDAKPAIIQVLYHQDLSAFTFPSGWELIGGEYDGTKINKIFVEWITGSVSHFWITQLP